MPIVDITCSRRVAPTTMRALSDRLPHLVSVAVQCEAEPYNGFLEPGDVNLRFHPLGAWDSVGIDILIEVKSKWFDDRARNHQQRVDSIVSGLRDLAGDEIVIGVYLTMPIAAWSQSNDD